MMGKKVSLNQRWLNGNAELLSAHREGWTATQWASLTPIQLYPHVSNGHRPRLYASYAAMSAGPTMRGVVTVEESLSLCLSFPSISSLDREETFLENSSGGQWASFLAWKRGESGAHAYECWRFEWYNIILYTHREKKEEENERRKEKDFCRKIE